MKAELNREVRALIGKHGVAAVLIAVREYAYERSFGMRYAINWHDVAANLTRIFDHITEGRSLSQ
jgi:hypothetical protein